MTQNRPHTPEDQMIQACAALYNVMERISNELEPFFGWKKIWQSECDRLLHAVESLRIPVGILVQSYQVSDHLPKDASTLIQAQVILQIINEYIDEACVRIVAYAENSDSLSEVHLRLRIRLRKYIQDDLLQNVEQLLDMLPLPLPQDVNMAVVVEETGDNSTAKRMVILPLPIAKDAKVGFVEDKTGGQQ